MSHKTLFGLDIEICLIKLMVFGGVGIVVDMICFIPLKTALTTNQLDAFLIGSPIFFMILGIFTEVAERFEIPKGAVVSRFLFFFTLGLSVIGALLIFRNSQLFKNMHITSFIVSVIVGLIIGVAVLAMFNLEAITYKNKIAGYTLTVLLVSSVYFYLYVIALGGILLFLLLVGLLGAGAGS